MTHVPLRPALRAALAAALLYVGGAYAEAVRTRVWTFSAVNPVKAVSLPQNIAWYQAESLRLDQQFEATGLTLSLTNSGVITVWEVASVTNATQVYIISTGTLVAASSNYVRWTVAPEDSNLSAGRYYGYLRALEQDGTNLVNIGVLARQTITVLASPDSRNYDYVGPLDHAMTVSLTNAYHAGHSDTGSVERVGNQLAITWPVPSGGTGTLTTATGSGRLILGTDGATVTGTVDEAGLVTTGSPVSSLDNDAGYLAAESDPTVPSGLVTTGSPVSSLDNDAGYLTAESDPASVHSIVTADPLLSGQTGDVVTITLDTAGLSLTETDTLATVMGRDPNANQGTVYDLGALEFFDSGKSPVMAWEEANAALAVYGDTGSMSAITVRLLPSTNVWGQAGVGVGILAQYLQHRIRYEGLGTNDWVAHLNDDGTFVIVSNDVQQGVVFTNLNWVDRILHGTWSVPGEIILGGSNLTAAKMAEWDETGTGGGGAGTITLDLMDQSATATGISTLRFDQADGFAVSNGDGVAYINLGSSFNPIIVGTSNVTANGEEPLILEAGSGITLTPGYDGSTNKITFTATGGGGDTPGSNLLYHGVFCMTGHISVAVAGTKTVPYLNPSGNAPYGDASLVTNLNGVFYVRTCGLVRATAQVVKSSGQGASSGEINYYLYMGGEDSYGGMRIRTLHVSGEGYRTAELSGSRVYTSLGVTNRYIYATVENTAPNQALTWNAYSNQNPQFSTMSLEIWRLP
jgi:hypothetical protein